MFLKIKFKCEQSLQSKTFDFFKANFPSTMSSGNPMVNDRDKLIVDVTNWKSSMARFIESKTDDALMINFYHKSKFKMM